MIAVEIAHDHGAGIGAHTEGSRRLEGPIAAAQQHGDGVVTVVGERQVLHPIAIEVAHGDGHGSRS